MRNLPRSIAMTPVIQASEPSPLPESALSASALKNEGVARSLRPVRFLNPTASAWSLSLSRRLLDVTVALAVVSVFVLPMLAIALCVRLTSPGPALFVQERVGRGGRLFRIYKFRSMVVSAPGKEGPRITRDGDRRITRLGRWLRRLKLDELPQFYNVLRGDMSIVGPRPKLPEHAVIVNMPYRPGITGVGTLAFRREEEILKGLDPSHLDAFYHRRITPFKARLDTRYMCRATPGSDLRLIAATVVACLTPERNPIAFRAAPTRVIGSQPPHKAERRGSESYETAS
ncbi:MAG: sugar transferase [Terracidiphilus sp.]